MAYTINRPPWESAFYITRVVINIDSFWTSRLDQLVVKNKHHHWPHRWPILHHPEPPYGLFNPNHHGYNQWQHGGSIPFVYAIGHKQVDYIYQTVISHPYHLSSLLLNCYPYCLSSICQLFVLYSSLWQHRIDRATEMGSWSTGPFKEWIKNGPW